ncbi:MAG: HpcH/HpaI aldolase/citrate lyase family protein [Thermoleophilia bacterium]
MLNLKQALDRGDALIGTFSTSGSQVMVETIGHAGLDFVIIDCEHAAVSPYGSDLANLIRAAWSANLAAAVRVTWNDPGQILKALDMGAAAVIVPHVNSAAEAAAAVSAGYHHPKGRRSATPAVIGSHQGLTDWPHHYSRSQDETLVVALIEEYAGVERIEEIAAVPGLGGIFFGPFDLAVSMGMPAEAHSADVASERERVYAAARANGLPVLDLAWSAAAALDLIEMGAQMVSVGVDVSLFAASCRELSDDIATAKRQLLLRRGADATDGATPSRRKR